MKKEDRKNGYYWVQQHSDERWIIAEYNNSEWKLTGNELGFHTDQWANIGAFIGNTFEEEEPIVTPKTK